MSLLSPFDVANWFLCNMDREAGDSITHLKLQKLIYYSQAWALVLNGKPLFEEDFEAWTHGPVIPEVYEQYKDFGFNALPACDCKNEVTKQQEYVLLEVKRVYGEKSAKYLEDLTHHEAPWIHARGNLPLEARCNNIISKDAMHAFYSELLNRNEQKG